MEIKNHRTRRIALICPSEVSKDLRLNLICFDTCFRLLKDSRMNQRMKVFAAFHLPNSVIFKIRMKLSYLVIWIQFDFKFSSPWNHRYGRFVFELKNVFLKFISQKNKCALLLLLYKSFPILKNILKNSNENHKWIAFFATTITFWKPNAIKALVWADNNFLSQKFLFIWNI